MKRILPRIFCLARCRRAFALFVGLLMVLGVPGVALASTDTLGDVIVSACNNLMPFADLFTWIAYTAGAFFGISATLMLAKHYENPNHAPMSQIIARYTGGSLLLVMPSVAGTLEDTLFTTDSGGGLLTCIVPVTTKGGASDPTVWLTNFVTNVHGPMIVLITAVAMVMGALMILRGLLKAAKYGTDPKATSITVILSNLIVGAVLLDASQCLDTILGSLFGVGFTQANVSATSTLSSVAGWAVMKEIDPTGEGTFTQGVQSALTFFQIVGFISFVRGWKIVKDSAEGSGQASMSQGLTHIIGGVMAINIFYVLEVIDATLGTGFLS